MKAFIFLCIGIFLFACRQQPEIPDDFDYGRIEDGVYKNDYFNMKVSLPSTWEIQSKDQMANLVNEGEKIIEKKNKGFSSKLKANQISTALLLIMFKNKRDSVVGQFNPSFMIIAENLGRISGIKTGVDYLDHLKKTLQQTGINYQVSPGYNTRNIGGKDFDVLKATQNVGEVMDVKTLYSVAIDKGFALTIITIFATDEQEDEITDVLHKITFM
jgi:hypothetical protein